MLCWTSLMGFIRLVVIGVTLSYVSVLSFSIQSVSNRCSAYYRAGRTPSSLSQGSEYAGSSHLSRLQMASDVVERLGLEDNFDRWRFMQKLLDYELDAIDVNQVLYLVLEGFLKYPRPVFVNEDGVEEAPLPLMTTELRDTLQKLLDMEDFDMVSALREPECSPGNPQVLQVLETLLPDPQEDEDAHKGNWDTVIELHGRESVKVNERKKLPQWQAACLVARVLIYYDFLTTGVVEKPLK